MSDTNTDFSALMDLVGFAVAHAVWSISDGELLIPFVLSEKDGQRKLSRFALERLDEGAAQARATLPENPEEADRAVALFDGYVTADGERIDSLIAEAIDYTVTSELVRVYTRYRPSSTEEDFAVLRPELEFPEDVAIAADLVTQSFFDGLYSHTQGAEVWDKRRIVQKPSDT